MSRLALGTVQFGVPYGIANRGGQVSREEATRMLQLAAAHDIDTIDTAIGYGDSETCLGAVGVKDFRVVTKLPTVPDACTDVAGWTREQVRGSLARLGLDRLHGVLLHRPEQLLGAHGRALYSALRRLKDDRLTEKIGISVYGPAELDVLMPGREFDLVQAPFSVVDRRLHRSGWMGRLHDGGVELHVRSVFLQGLLLMPPEERLQAFAAWTTLWTAWDEWLRANSTSALDACLSFALGFPEIDRVVVGAQSSAQWVDIVVASVRTANAAPPDVACDDEQLINPALWAR